MKPHLALGLLPALLASVLLAGCGGEAPASKPAPPKVAPAQPVAPSEPVPEVEEEELPEPDLDPSTTTDKQPPADKELAPEPGGHGRFVARVVYDGKLPVAVGELDISGAVSEGCDHSGKTVDTTDRSLLVNLDGGVIWAVVSLEGEEEVDGTGQTVTIDQVGCRFEPHVSVVPVGGRVEFRNSDSMNHNVHAFAKKTTSPNVNVAPGGSDSFVLKGDETFKVACDIHPWMATWVVATETPYTAVSDASGNVVFENVPAGEYKLKVWHEKLELVTSGGGGGRRGSAPKVVIKNGETTELELKLTP